MPTPEWVGRHARPRDMVAVLRVVADRTTTGDTLGRTVRAFLGLPPRDEGAVAAGWGMANTFDLLASEYGWSLDQILDLSLTQIRRISDAIAARYRRQNPDSGDGESGREHDEHGRRRKVEPIDLGDPTWQITRVDPHGGPWDSVSPAVAEKFKAAGYVSMMDFHEKGRAKLERVEAEAGAGRR